MSVKEGEIGSFNYARPFDGRSNGEGYGNWRDMLYAEPLAKSQGLVFDGKIPQVPELAEDGSNKAIVIARRKALAEYSRDAKRMVGHFTKLCSGEPALIAHKYIAECRAMEAPLYSVTTLLARWDARYANSESRATKLVTLKLFLSVRQQRQSLDEYCAEFDRLVLKLANFSNPETFSQPLMALLFLVGLHADYRTFVQTILAGGGDIELAAVMARARSPQEYFLTAPRSAPRTVWT